MALHVLNSPASEWIGKWILKFSFKKAHKDFPSGKMILSPNSLWDSRFCMTWVSPILWLSGRSCGLGNLLLVYKKFCKNYYQKHIGLTWQPHEVWRIKAEIFFTSWTIFGNEKSESCENIPHCIQQWGRSGSGSFSTQSTQARADSVLMFPTAPCVMPASSSSAICAAVFTPVMN